MKLYNVGEITLLQPKRDRRRGHILLALTTAAIAAILYFVA
jgi:hypothetical protein